MKKYLYLMILMTLLGWDQSQAVNSCTAHIQRIEQTEGIPKNLLAAMARVESGRYNKATDSVEPWPWTIQSGGKSNYFSTKGEAVAHAKALHAKGIKNFDVGCMQINYEHHGHKFNSIEQMFEPAVNVAQGAKYLKQLKSDKSKAWSTAVGNYHSFTPEHHNRYKNLVLKNLSLVNKENGGLFAVEGPFAKGSLFSTPAKIYSVRPPMHQGNAVRASLYSYSRSRGMTGVRAPVKGSLHRPTHKMVKLTKKKRIAQMKGVGIYDLGFGR